MNIPSINSFATRTEPYVCAALSALAVAGCAPIASLDAGSDLSIDGPLPSDGGLDLAAGPCRAGNWDYLVEIPADRSCDADTDCAMTPVPELCCGSAHYRGVRASDLARYNAAVGECATTIAASHCFLCPPISNADDGTIMLYGRPPTVEVHCVAHVCTTTIVGSVLCGPGACSPGEFCGESCHVDDDGGWNPAPECAYPSPCDGGTYCECARGGACRGGTCVDGLDGGFTCTCP